MRSFIFQKFCVFIFLDSLFYDVTQNDGNTLVQGSIHPNLKCDQKYYLKNGGNQMNV